MRYLISMIGAIAVALVATLFVASPVASFVVSRFTFDSPDTVADLHSAVFMGVNVLAVAIGWSIGWAIGGRFENETHVE